MYSMYPEWGPARHRDDDDTESMSAPARRPRYWERDLVGATAGARDAAGDRPDDN